jgi:hypothetical protein
VSKVVIVENGEVKVIGEYNGNLSNNLQDIYNYGKAFIDACNYADITEEQGLKFLEIFSRFRKSE